MKRLGVIDIADLATGPMSWDKAAIDQRCRAWLGTSGVAKKELTGLPALWFRLLLGWRFPVVVFGDEETSQ